MFMGEYRHNLDAKGRLTLPSKFRTQYETGIVVVTKGFDGCLSVYSPGEWEKFYTKLLAIPSSKKQVRTLVRIIASKATECEIDSMGRINIPQSLREDALLFKEAVIIGSLDHVEIWSEEKWDAFYDEEGGKLEAISEALEMDF